MMIVRLYRIPDIKYRSESRGREKPSLATNSTERDMRRMQHNIRFEN